MRKMTGEESTTRKVVARETSATRWMKVFPSLGDSMRKLENNEPISRRRSRNRNGGEISVVDLRISNAIQNAFQKAIPLSSYSNFESFEVTKNLRNFETYLLINNDETNSIICFYS